MTPPRPTELARQILQDAIHPGDTVIDATAGNGHDTLFLAECVGHAGRVLAFDLQEQAIGSARNRIADAGFSGQVAFLHTSHARMQEHAEPASVSVVMFNLGYLPGEDHAFTTQPTETLAALDAANALLKPRGLLSVVCYPGHATGALESVDVETWMTSQAGHGWRIAKYGMLGTLRPSPFLLIAQKPQLKTPAESRAPRRSP